MVGVKLISKEEATAILKTEEGHYTDVKAIDILPSKLSNTISAFANAAGGEIFLGVDEDDAGDGKKKRKWRGFTDIEAANAHIQVLDELGPLANHYQLEFLEADRRKGYVLHLTIAKTTAILNATDGIPRVRKNAQNLKVDTPEKLRRLQLDKGIVSFEDETVNTDVAYVADTNIAQGFMTTVVPRSTAREWLEKQFLTRNGMPTVAAKSNL